MDCQTAQQDMHRRLDADTAGTTGDFTALDAHLARCPRCSRTWLELLAARERLGNLRETGPTPEEIDTMWQAIDAAVPAELPAIQLPSRGVIFRFLGATAAVAACLFIAFILGEQRYGHATNTSDSIRALTTSKLRGLGQAYLTYAADHPNEHATPIDRAQSMWALVRDGDITPREFISPSTGNPIPGEAELLPGFSDKSTIGFAYQVPSSPTDEQTQSTSRMTPRHSVGWPGQDASEGREQAVGQGMEFRMDRRGRASAGTTVQSPLSSQDLSRLEALGYVSAMSDSTSVDDDRNRDEVQLAFGRSTSSTTASTDKLDFATDRNERLAAGSYGMDYSLLADAGETLTVADGLSHDHEGRHGGEVLGKAIAGREIQAGNAVAAEYYAKGDASPTPPETPDTAGVEIKYHAGSNEKVVISGLPTAELDSIRMVGDSISEVQDNTGTPDSDGLADNTAANFGALRVRGDRDSTRLKDQPTLVDRWYAGGSTLLAEAGQPGQAPQPAELQAQDAQVTRTVEPRPRGMKVIKTASLTTEVEDYEQALQDVNAVLDRFDCFLADASTKEAAGGALVGELIVRVSPADFENLFAALRQVGRLESEDIKSADVTADYVDIEARIAALKITEERLIELVKSKSFVDRIEDLLKVEQEMNRVRTEIEQNEGRLRVMADRVALSTISMTLREPARTVPSASMSVEVPVLDDAAAALGETLVALDARMVSGKVTQLDQGALVGEYRVKVSLARFGDALAAISALGRVEARDVRDWREQSASAKWADRVTCDVALKLIERTRDLPSGTLSVQVENLPKALAALDELLPPSDAAITSNRTSKRDDGSSTADLQVRIPAGKFTALVAKLDALGRVTAKQLTGEAGSIAGGAADTPCTLSLALAEPVRQIPSGGMVIEVQTFADARDRLAELVGRHRIQVLAANSSQRTDGTWVGQFKLGIVASNIDTAVGDLEKLGKVSSREIRGIGLGELSKIDANALGVLEIILAEKAAINPGAEGNTIRSYVRDGLSGLYSSLGLIAYGLVVMAPWLVIALLLGWFITRIWKRRRASATASTKRIPT